MRKLLLLIILQFLLLSCTRKSYTISLMPTPTIYYEGVIPMEGDRDTSLSLLYATNRKPATGNDKEKYYSVERGDVVRSGTAVVRLTDTSETSEKVTDNILDPNKSNRYRVVLDTTIERAVLPYTSQEVGTFINEHAQMTEDEYAAEINHRLRRTASNEIFIYMHGYKVPFDRPLLAAAQWWNFTGADDIWIAYSWPSTAKNPLAYFADLETASVSSRYFRRYLEFLSEKTGVEKINIVVWSAGTRVVFQALNDLALLYGGKNNDSAYPRVKLGNVVFIGSDMGSDMLRNYISNGIYNVADAITVYQSDADGALRSSKRVFRDDRVGQVNTNGIPEGLSEEFLKFNNNIHFVDVSGINQYDAGNGHGYFFKAPWASSDIIGMLRYGLSPEERGLVRIESPYIWRFPENYMEVLSKSIQSRIEEK